MDVHKLAKVLAMAASDNESEALHALRTAKRLLDGHGLDFVEVAQRVAATHAPAAAGSSQAPAAVGSMQAHVEDLEDALFDLRNEIRRLRADNERLRQGRSASAEAPSLADAARDAAAAIRLRAELAEARDRGDLLETQLLEARAHEAQTREHLRQEMAEAQRLAAELADARQRIGELSARLLAAETRTAPEPRLRKPTGRAGAKAPAAQYALL